MKLLYFSGQEQLHFYRSSYRYLKNGVSKSIVVSIKPTNFQIYKAYSDGVFGKTGNWRQLYKQTSSTFYKKVLCVSPNNVLRRKTNLDAITRAFLYRSVDVQTSASVYGVAVRNETAEN